MKGFIEPGPRTEQLKPTSAELVWLRKLLEWQEQSAKCHHVLGPSVGCPKCHVDNNPNNACCWHCGAALK